MRGGFAGIKIFVEFKMNSKTLTNYYLRQLLEHPKIWQDQYFSHEPHLRDS